MYTAEKVVVPVAFPNMSESGVKETASHVFIGRGELCRINYS